MADLDRIYEMLRQQGETLRIQGETLARIDESQKNTHDRLFQGSGNIPGAIPYLFAEVSKHGRQITFWRGALAVISVVFTTAMAWAGTVLAKHVK